MFFTYVIYGDIYFLLNFFMDLFLLWSAGRFLRQKIVLWRLVSAALLGAAYAFGGLFPTIGLLYLPPFKIIFSFLLVAAAYPYNGFRSFVRLIAAFYLMSFAAAGAATGFSYLLMRQGVAGAAQQTVNVFCLGFGGFFVAVLARRGLRRLQTTVRREDFRLILRLTVADRTVSLPALIDTGNELLDPVSQSPVIVCEYKAVAALMPNGLTKIIDLCGLENPTKVLENTCFDGWERRLRLVPFASLGKSHGLLLGFRPDRVEVDSDYLCEDVIICLTGESLQNGCYQAIINPQALVANERKAAV